MSKKALIQRLARSCGCDVRVLAFDKPVDRFHHFVDRSESRFVIIIIYLGCFYMHVRAQERFGSLLV